MNHREPLLILLSTALIGCGDDPIADPGEYSRTECAKSGTPHSGSISNEVWAASKSPHHLRDTVDVSGTLTIEAGALVCGAPGALLRIGFSTGGTLVAVGTEAEPVVFTPASPDTPWGGILLTNPALTAPPRASLSHIRMEHALDGLLVGLGGSTVIENSHFRHASIGAASISSCCSPQVVLRNSLVDTGDVAVSTGTLENNVIRGGGLRLTGRGSTGITIAGGRIENSPGVALSVGSKALLQSPGITVSRPLRILGSRGNPVDVPVDLFLKMWPTRELQDSLLGNVNDTLALWIVGTMSPITPPSFEQLVVRRDLPWRLVSVFGPFMTVNHLTIEPGGHLELANLILTAFGTVSAVGSDAAPITIRSAAPSSWALSLTGMASSHFSNVTFSKIRLTTSEQHVVDLDHVRSNDFIRLASPGSDIVDSEMSDVSSRDIAALLLAADGTRAERIRVQHTSGRSDPGNVPSAAIAIAASNVQVQGCEIRDNANDGIRVLSGTNAQIHECNIERNGGFGVANQSASSVDARRNWWGDPAGPLAPGGDGVSGEVDFSEWLNSPVNLSLLTTHPLQRRFSAPVVRAAKPLDSAAARP